MKTYQDWGEHQTLTSYLNPGDEVDQEMVNYFCGTLPPQTMTSTVIQIGEPHDHFRDRHRHLRPIFATIQRTGNNGFIRGCAFPDRHSKLGIIFLLQKKLKTKISAMSISKASAILSVIYGIMVAGTVSMPSGK